MNLPQPFLYDPAELPGRKLPHLRKGMPMTVATAAELVMYNNCNDHDFTVNPNHQSSTVDILEKQILSLNLRQSDGDAYVLWLALKEAIESAKRGRYGVGAVLADTRNKAFQVVAKARNARVKGHAEEFQGHAETRLVRKATPYVQEHLKEHPDLSGHLVGVNLCPCPGCLAQMIDIHFPEVVIGTIDPRVGAAYLKNRDLQVAVGEPRQRVLKEKGLKYRFADIRDSRLRHIIGTLSWDVFHTTRKRVHKAEHGEDLKE